MKKHLFWGLDAGILEVLPYHECDLMSKDTPDYLKCLLNLQVQNIAYRFSVFITGETLFYLHICVRQQVSLYCRYSLQLLSLNGL